MSESRVAWTPPMTCLIDGFAFFTLSEIIFIALIFAVYEVYPTQSGLNLIIWSFASCQIALSVTKKMQIPALVGLHIKANGKLPSDEKIYDVINECKKYNILGVILSCVSPETIEPVSYTHLTLPTNREV